MTVCTRHDGEVSTLRHGVSSIDGEVIAFGRVATYSEGMTNLDTVVGRNIHARMWDARITQTKAAPAIGVTQSALSKKLRGERPWTLDELYAAARVLGCTVDDLLPHEAAAQSATGQYETRLLAGHRPRPRHLSPVA